MSVSGEPFQDNTRLPLGGLGFYWGCMVGTGSIGAGLVERSRSF
jgi:hypothetical protein